jgi:hypothetical protein
MSRRQQQGTIDDRTAILRTQRETLQTDLAQVSDLIETELASWAERRAAVHDLQQAVGSAMESEADEARMEWYAAAYHDAQQAQFGTHALVLRYNEIARALTACQQELMQLPREHRRG